MEMAEDIMTQENISLFKVQVLRVLAHLYKNFPAPITIEHSTLLNNSENEGGGVTVELESGSEAGTILWLYNQGFVAGNLLEGNSRHGTRTAAITKAQLTATSLRILESPEQNANGVPLGELLVTSAFSGSEATAADILSRRILGT
jgi:hypothetical protein